MKKLSILLIFFICLFTLKTFAQQPQWKFYIAFQDNTGAKDTIWCIWDSLASSTGVDTIFGENAIPIDTSKFNVFLLNPIGDTTKTSALDFFGAHQLYVQAINYEHPLTISWDTTILNTYLSFLPTHHVNYARIDNDYFFFVNNSNFNQFDMTIDNHVLAPSYPWPIYSQFPTQIILLSDPSIGISENETTKETLIYPNPAKNVINVKSNLLFDKVEIYNMEMKQLKYFEISKTNTVELDVSELNSGLYFITIIHKNKMLYHEIFFKNH